MKQTLLVASSLIALAIPQVARATPGQWNVGQQVVEYPVIGADGIYTEVNGDGSNNHGGVPPVYSIMPADVTQTLDPASITTGGSSTGVDENKMRLSLFSDHVGRFDPIKGHGILDFGHLHVFLGNKFCGPSSDFTQLRTDAVAAHNAGKVATTTPGDAINATCYWESAVLDGGAMSAPLGTGTTPGPLGDGVVRIKKILVDPFYYQMPNLTRTDRFVDIPNGLDIIGGKNMADPFDLRLQAYIAAANAANVAAGGTAGRYTMTGEGDGAMGWTCDIPAGGVRDGPKDNIDDLTCNAGDILLHEMHGPGCLDGRNLSSPDGMSHVLPMIRVQAANGDFSDICPLHWFKMAVLINKTQYVLAHAISSATPYDSPFLDSDAAFQAKARADASRCITATEHGTSATICAPAGASTYVCKAGCSEHFDWMGAWKRLILLRFHTKCLNIPVTDPTHEPEIDADQTPNGYACNSGTVSYNGTTGTVLTTANVIVPATTDVDGDRIQEYYPTPKGHMGPGTMSH